MRVLIWGYKFQGLYSLHHPTWISAPPYFLKFQNYLLYCKKFYTPTSFLQFRNLLRKKNYLKHFSKIYKDNDNIPLPTPTHHKLLNEIQIQLKKI